MYAIKLGNDYNGATIFLGAHDGQTTTAANAVTFDGLRVATANALRIRRTINKYAEVVRFA